MDKLFPGVFLWVFALTFFPVLFCRADANRHPQDSQSTSSARLSFCSTSNWSSRDLSPPPLFGLLRRRQVPT